MEPRADKPALALTSDRFFVSPYVFSCCVALDEKALPYDLEVVALDRAEQKAPAYQAATVTGKVPALRHRQADGSTFVLAESSAIVEYLDDVFGAPGHTPVLPTDARERARARQIMAWIRSDLMALRDERPTHTMFYQRADKPLSEAGRAAAQKLCDVATRVLPDGKSQLFSTWSVADADLAFMLHRLILNGHEVPSRVRAFAEAQWQRPSVRAFVDRERPSYVPY